MGIDNVKLWFAKNENGEIVTIDDLKDSNTYSCPVCGSDLIPKAIESKRITPHFAHVDKSKCNNESMMHFWFKHKFLEQGDSFKIVTDKEIEYVCKNILVEQGYIVGDKIYRPDVTITTECGKTVYFEMNYSNKKEVKDYIDIWLELKNNVVEIDIKQLMNKNSLPSFKALFYEGKCFNTKRNDTYYNTIGKYKERMCRNGINDQIKERIRKLDWFWEDVFKYQKSEVDILHMADMIDLIDSDDKDIVFEICGKKSCQNLHKNYVEYKMDKVFKEVADYVLSNYDSSYIKYISKDISFNRYIGYTAQVHVFHENENCFYAIDIIDEKINFQKDIDDVFYNNDLFLRKKNMITSYNENSKLIKEKIINNGLFKSFCSSLEGLMREYSVGFTVETVNIKDRFFNEATFINKSHKLSFYLNYKKNHNHVERYVTDINIETEIDSLIQEMALKFKNYISATDPFEEVTYLNDTIKSLNSFYANYKVEVNGYLNSEDIFNVYIVIDNYKYIDFYITNQGIISSPCRNITNGKYTLLKNLASIEQVEKYLRYEINKEITKVFTTDCIKCEKMFSLSLGEIKFFVSKGFNFPKRCKRCRKNK